MRFLPYGGRANWMRWWLLLFVAAVGFTGCAQEPAVKQSTQSQFSSQDNVLSKFRDIVNSTSPLQDNSVGGGGTAVAHGASSANSQPVIYQGDGVGQSSSAVGSPNVGTSQAPSGVVPAAYTVAKEGLDAVEGGKFQVTFENADINAVARAVLGDALKSNYSIDPRVRGTVSLSTQRPVSGSQLLLLLESALRAQSAVIVHENGFYRILPASDVHAVGGVNIGADAGAAGFGVTALPLQDISAEAMTKILEGFGAPSGSVHVDAGRNLLLIQGTTSERQSLLDTALAFDVNWMRNQSVGIFPIKHGSPEVIINELNQLADASIMKFQPISRLNAVLTVAKSLDAVHQVQTWIARLDRQNDYGLHVHVYRLKSAEARKVVGVLREIFGSGSSSSGSEQIAPGAPMAIAKAPGAPPPSPSDTNKPEVAARGGDSGGGGSGEGSAAARVRITADVVSNAVVVYAGQEDYRSIERAIIDLDRPSAEVTIEAIAAEVTLNDNLNYGVQFFLGSALKGVPISVGQLSAALPLAATVPGANLLVGALANPSVVISALRDVTDVKILSSPSLVVADNQPAILQVGDQVPVTTGTATSVITTQSSIVNSVSYVDTGVILRVTPHISRTNEVRLDIEQEVSAVEQNASATTLTPTISQQKVKSTVIVDNGQTVLLAGLISQQRSQEKTGIPGAIDIPFLGNALSNSTNSAKRTELIIFVKPQVIRNSGDAQRVAQELRRRMPGFNNW
jgi:general secretion pathway protein D